MGAAVAGLALAGLVLVGCSAARTDVGTTDETCYLALPTAANAVGPGAHLVGIRKFEMTSLKGISPRLYAQMVKTEPAKQAVCIAAYTGHFSSSRWPSPWGVPSARSP